MVSQAKRAIRLRPSHGTRYLLGGPEEWGLGIGGGAGSAALAGSKAKGAGQGQRAGADRAASGAMEAGAEETLDCRLQIGGAQQQQLGEESSVEEFWDMGAEGGGAEGDAAEGGEAGCGGADILEEEDDDEFWAPAAAPAGGAGGETRN